MKRVSARLTRKEHTASKMVDTINLLKMLAVSYYQAADKTVVDFNAEAIDGIRDAYPIRVQAINTLAFDAIGSVSIDPYKKFALYIQLCLERPLFSVKRTNAESKLQLDTILINELFSFEIMRVLLQTRTHKKLDAVSFDKYKYPLLKLLGYYKEYCAFHKWNLFFTFNFAHLMYFIEKEFFK